MDPVHKFSNIDRNRLQPTMVERSRTEGEMEATVRTSVKITETGRQRMSCVT